LHAHILAQAKLALDVVNSLVRAGGVASVAVLTPYRGQVGSATGGAVLIPYRGQCSVAQAVPRAITKRDPNACIIKLVVGPHDVGMRAAPRCVVARMQAAQGGSTCWSCAQLKPAPDLVMLYPAQPLPPSCTADPGARARDRGVHAVLSCALSFCDDLL